MKDWGPDVDLAVRLPAEVVDDLDFVAFLSGLDRADATRGVLTQWARGTDATPTERDLWDRLTGDGWTIVLVATGRTSRAIANDGTRHFCVSGDGTCFDVLEQLVRHIAGADSEP
jgi:hypothetical protein